MISKKSIEEIQKINIHDAIHKAVLALSKNYILAIVSSTASYLIEEFITKENLRENFSDILGIDVNSNKTIKINSLLEKYKINPKDAVFITDSLGDILEAAKCDVKSIAVTWGLHDKETLEKGNPVVLIGNPEDLHDAIQDVVK